MVHIQWKERYSINYKEVDAQHKRLLDILNQLLDLVECRRPPDEISVVFHRLCAYALDHFTLEERYLEAAAYPALARQKEEHAHFVGRILELNERYDPADPELLRETFRFLKTWFLRHILRTDTEYMPWVRRFYREARIRAVLVDGEGLLAATDRSPLLGLLAARGGKPADELDRLVFGEGLHADFQAGAIDGAQFRLEVSRACGAEVPEGDLAEAVGRMMAPLDTLQELLRSLSGRLKVALVADADPWQAQGWLRLPGLDLFDAVSLSHEIKARVPDHRILGDALDKLGLVSEECLFLTVRQDRAEAAERQLFHGHVFQDTEAVAKALERRA